mgnify:CR=1 FL=1
MKAIVTVVGKDRIGIVAGVSAKLSELGLNIDDISQTILDEFFTMMAVVSSEENKDFTALRAELNELGESLKVISKVLLSLMRCIQSKEKQWTSKM